MPTVDELFPEQPRSVDELFPADVERERYRQRQLNTSPIQDLIFGGTEVNPVARVLDAFGQGVRHAWGAHNDQVSKESEEFLKASKQYDEWIKGQQGITKAANEVLFRPAASQLYREFRDAQGIFHGIGAVIAGTQAAIAQIGTEVGQPKLGREVAAGFEAFPSGLRQPTGIPHGRPVVSPVKNEIPSEAAPTETTLSIRGTDYSGSLKDNPVLREIDRGRDLKTVGAGEGGYMGTADVPAPSPKEVAPIIREEFESGMHQPVEAKPAEPVAPTVEPVAEAPAEPPAQVTGTPINADHPIAQDVAGRLVRAGRPADEASATAQIIASHYEARAARFGGALGTAEELYAKEGADIRGPGGKSTDVVSNGGANPVPAEFRLGTKDDTGAWFLKGDKPIYANATRESLNRLFGPEEAAQFDSYESVKGVNKDGAPITVWYKAGERDRALREIENFKEKAVGSKDAARLHYESGINLGYPETAARSYVEQRFGPGSLKRETAQSRWDIFVEARQARRTSAGIQTGYNPETSKSGSQLRGRESQVWEPGNIVKVGFVDNLLIVSKDEDGAATLLSRPDKNGLSKSYEFTPHEGLGKGKPVDFLEATKDLRSPPPRIKMGVESAPERSNQSLLDFLAREGGLKPTADLEQIFGGKNPVIPGAGRLFRKDGMTMDEALTRAKENSFVIDPNDIQHAPDSGMRGPKGENTVRWQELQDMIAEEAAGRKQYRNTRSLDEAKINLDEEAGHIKDALYREVEATGGNVRDIDPVTADRVVELIQKGEAKDVMGAYEQAIMEVEYNQIKRGHIRLKDGEVKPIITLLKDANESTFIHETGHHWLEELMRDAKHEKAPADLIADSKAVLDWFGVDSADKIKTRHHEQFARGFERYMMEGVAPSRELAGVFAKFRDWLTRIYETVTRLKSPINDEIRGVFDRLIAQDPQKVRIEPEAPKSFADIHEADALHTPLEASHPVAETIQAERDRLATEQLPSRNDARLENVAPEARSREAGSPQSVRDGNEAGRVGEGAGDNQAPGAVGEGGNNAPAESARPSTGARTEVPVSAGEPFKTTETPLVDKAGNIRLDNLSTPEDVNAAIRDAAEKNNDFIDARRGVVTDGQVLELADALGMDAGQLNQRKLGQAFNAEQIMSARKLLIQSATDVRDAMVKAANGSEADILAYAAAKDRHQMIQAQVAGITAEAGRALRAFRKLDGQHEAKQLDAFLKDNTGKTLFQLQREAQLGMQLDTPAQVSKFINDAAKPTFKDMIIEAWMASLLSGLKTHMANITGNTISGLWRPIETATAAGIGKARSLVTGSQDRVLFGEAAAEMFGMIHGSKEGIVAAYKAFKTEEPQMTSTRQIEQGNPKALPSMTVNLFGREMEIGGKQARIPLRLLGAEDEFFKSVAFRGDINRQAYAIAAKENLPAERFNARVAELSMNPTEEMVAHAKEVADYQTFQTPLGKVGRSVQNFANSHILAKIVVPFVRTPINLLKYAGERTPLGLFSRDVRDNLSGKNGNVARDTQIARITLGTMIGVTAFEMAANGYITGGGPADKGKKAIMQADGWQDYSIRIGDMYYRYNRLDPFSIILGLAADTHEIMKAGGSDRVEKERLPAMIFAAITKNVTDRASLKGPSDLIQAINEPERYGKGYIKGLAGTVVPAISAQTAQTMDPVVREARTIIDGIKARIPGLSQTLHPRRDIWGEPVTREGGLGPDIASPIAEARIKNDPVNKALIGANYFPSKIDRKIRGVELTDQQYDDYSRIAGRTAKMRLDMIVKMPGFNQMPESTRKELMTKAVTTSREMARSLIMMQNPEILRKANDAKMPKAGAN